MRLSRINLKRFSLVGNVCSNFKSLIQPWILSMLSPRFSLTSFSTCATSPLPTRHSPHFYLLALSSISPPAGRVLPLWLCGADKREDPTQRSKLSAKARYGSVRVGTWRVLKDLLTRSWVRVLFNVAPLCVFLRIQCARSTGSWWPSWGRSWSPGRRRRSCGSAGSSGSECLAATSGSISTTQDTMVEYPTCFNLIKTAET